MADTDLVIASTTDTPADLEAALLHGTEPREPEAVLGEVDRATGEPVAEGSAPVTTPDTRPESEPVPEPEKAAAPAQPARGAKPKREDFPTEEAWVDALIGHRAQKRIAKLTAERGEQQRRAEALQAELDRVRYTQPAAPVPAPAPVDTPQPVALPPDPQVQALERELSALGPRPKLDNFDTTEAWEDALTGYAVRQAELSGQLGAAKVVAGRRQEEAVAAQAQDATERYDQFLTHREAARARYDDFDEVIAAAADLPLSEPMQYVIMSSPVGHDIAHYLALPDHRDEAEALAALPPEDQPAAAHRLEGRILARLEAAGITVGPATSPPAVRRPGTTTTTTAGTGTVTEPASVTRTVVTQASDPIRPVGGRATSTSTPLDAMDYRTYTQVRNRQEAERRRGRR